MLKSILIISSTIILSGCYTNLGVESGKKEIRTQAVERGFAKWEVSSDGQTEFSWNASRK